jgi:mono/diheme cytochrome c family protein
VVNSRLPLAATARPGRTSAAIAAALAAAAARIARAAARAGFAIARLAAAAPIARAAARAGFAIARLAAAIALAGAGLAGCNSDPAGGTKDGAAVFGMLCASCHGADGRPPAAMVARLNVRDLTAPDFRARVTPALVEQQVRHGSANKLMPAFEGAITDDQIRAVAAFVAGPRFAGAH